MEQTSKKTRKQMCSGQETASHRVQWLRASPSWRRVVSACHLDLAVTDLEVLSAASLTRGAFTQSQTFATEFFLTQSLLPTLLPCRILQPDKSGTKEWLFSLPATKSRLVLFVHLWMFYGFSRHSS